MSDNTKTKKRREHHVRIVQASSPVAKAETPTQLSAQETAMSALWITPPIDLRGLKSMVSHSTILPQCIRAYQSNIAGFGIGVRYKDDTAETPEMRAEFTRMEDIIELLNLECDTKEVFEALVRARETYGIAYLEVIRNMAGEVVQIEFIRDTPSIAKTYPLDPYMPSEFYYRGQAVTRSKRYCKYKQYAGAKTVYFKEFGDRRVMDNRDGEYREGVEIQHQANEIIEFALGPEPYGEVRWIGQILGVDGSRKAEGLNNNYFENGRHTPLMILIKGGTLTDDSFSKLQRYMDDIKGAAGQHAFIIVEAENTDNMVDFEGRDRPEIEIKDLAGMLQKDELFQNYLDNSRRKVQSAFQLPDLYVAYTTDFNRSTAQTAQEVTEKQVFQPERRSLAWIVNNKLLAEYQFKHVEAYFLEPDISNPEDLARILSVTERAGGLTPNKAKQLTLEAFGEVSEDYPDEWGDIPLAYAKSQAGPGTGRLQEQLAQQIQKAQQHNDDAVVAVMKEVRSLLQSMSKGGEQTCASA